MKSKKYYAYFLLKGGSGICDNWTDCEKKVKGIQGARFQGFKTEAEAGDWLKNGAQYQASKKSVIRKPVKLQPGIYFDAGTGRGMGVEISVTDSHGNNLLHKVLPKSKINEHGKHLISGNKTTNNYGELLACYYALQLVMKDNSKNIYPERSRRIFGDSSLVLNYWSQGIINKKHLPKKTLKLSEEVTELRKEFESTGGKMHYVSGDYNPADLGFH